MNWGLMQGLVGRAVQALTPSPVSLGPNTYLAEKDFRKMLAIAFIVHMVAFGIYAIIPNQKVTDIPVRALSFKLGSEDRVGAYAPTSLPATPAVAPPVMQATTGDSWRATPNMPAPVVPSPLKAMPRIAPPKPVKAPKVVKVEDPAPAQYTPVQPTIAPVPMLAPLPAQAAVAPQPQQYVREVGAPTQQIVAAAVKAASPDGAINGQGATTSMTAQTAQETRARYTLQVSSWVQRHMEYPEAAGGREGRVVVRVQLDRFGNVRYNAIEQTSGLQVFDTAALDMIRRANPMPAPPGNYPDIDSIAFTIPLNFKAPK